MNDQTDEALEAAWQHADETAQLRLFDEIMERVRSSTTTAQDERDLRALFRR